MVSALSNDLERSCINSQVVRVVEDVLRTDDEDDKVDEVDIAIKFSTPSKARDRITYSQRSTLSNLC
jgi:hypothetical protein